MVSLDENCCNTCARARLNRAGCDWIAGRKANSALIFRRLPDFVLLLFLSRKKGKLNPQNVESALCQCNLLLTWRKKLSPQGKSFAPLRPGEKKLNYIL